MNTGILHTAHSPFARVKAAPGATVRLTGGFWAKRVEQCRSVTLGYLYDRMADKELSHCLENFRIAAGLCGGEARGSHWHDEWMYKWIEAAAALYAKTNDPALDERMDALISLIGRAQSVDGYLVTHTIIDGSPRFANNRKHELYVMGHLITAACAHYRATGKRSFLDIAIRTADYLDAVFGTMPPALCRAHNNPTQIMALAELFRTTGEEKYLRLADTFMSMQGAHREAADAAQAGFSSGDRNQDRIPLRQERDAVGHMVLGTYLYAGAADLYLETGDPQILAALESIWDDMAAHKMYINGGVCALHIGLSARRDSDGVIRGKDVVVEAAGDSYELPNQTAYNETCAQIGMLMFSWRMFLITGQAKYADLCERCLYGGILSGIGLDGKSWFYSNLLRYHGAEHLLHTKDAGRRFQPGLSMTCCPTNLLRTVAEADEYLYARGELGLWTALYASSVYEDSEVCVEQETAYPWEGDVTFRVRRAPADFTLYLRIPEWAGYRRILKNGTALADGPADAGFFAVPCASGDTVALSLPMQARLWAGNRRIEHTRGHAAVQRGPILYCAESADLPQGVCMAQVYLQRGAAFEESYCGTLDAVILQTRGLLYGDERFDGALYAPLVQTVPLAAFPLRLIPYYAWANRTEGEMAVWLPVTLQQAPLQMDFWPVSRL